MGLKQLTALEINEAARKIANTLHYLQELESEPLENFDNDHITFESELESIQRNTGLQLHQIMDAYDV